MQKRALRRPLWRCPLCGHRFTAKNMSHSCGRWTLAVHFKGRPRRLRQVFDRIVQIARSCGPAMVYAQKTRIVIQQRVRFAGAVVRSDWLDVHLWLKREVNHPRLSRTEELGGLGFACHFKLRDPTEIDESLADLVHEAYHLAQEGNHI